MEGRGCDGTAVEAGSFLAMTSSTKLCGSKRPERGEVQCKQRMLSVNGHVVHLCKCLCVNACMRREEGRACRRRRGWSKHLDGCLGRSLEDSRSALGSVHSPEQAQMAESGGMAYGWEAKAW